MGADDRRADDTLTPTEQDTVNFYEHPLVAVRLSDGRICAVLRWLCEGMQLDPSGQVQRIERKTALAEGLVRVRVDTPGGPQSMPALTLDVLPGWLFGIDENRVKPEVRDEVIRFQRECVRVLAAHFAHHSHPVLPAPAALVPVEPVAQPASPGRGASQEQWQQWQQWREAMRIWLDWQDDMAAWRQLSERRQEELEQRQDGLESRMEGVEELSRLFVEVTERLGPVTLSPAHQASVKNMARRLNELTGLAYAAIYAELNDAFHVGRYADIPEAEWPRVTAWLQTRVAAVERRLRR